MLTGLVLGCGSDAAVAAPVRLRVEQRVNPLGIDVLRPSFSWQSDSVERGWRQAAYRIRVASSGAGLKAGKGDVWDSGRVGSGESVGLVYAGPALESRRRYYWAVEVWDAKGASAEAASGAWWEMGLLQPEDWKAAWIGRNDPAAGAELKRIRFLGLPEAQLGRAVQPKAAEFSYKLHLEGKPTSASAHVYSPGTFTVKVNGAVTGHKSAWNSFDREDVRDRLVYGAGAAGDNTIVVSVTAPAVRGEAKGNLPAAMAAVVRVVQGDGKLLDAVSDGTWMVRAPVEGPGGWIAVQDFGPMTEVAGGPASPTAPGAGAPKQVETTAALLRREFEAPSGVVSARLYVTALGSYRALLNGRQVGDNVLTPEFSDYRKRVLYQTYDVTSMVAKGRNTLAAMLGGGWHGSPMGWSGTRVFAGPDLLRAQLDMTLADGTRTVVSTDGSWQTAAAPIVFSEIYAGEVYDARLAQAGWEKNGFAAKSGWTAAVAGMPVGPIQITSQPDLPVHRADMVKPVGVTMVGGDAVFDMGQNMVGAVKLRVRGPRGTTVRMRFAERLNPDGTVYTENLRNADATDEYTLSGAGEEVWTPAFTFHGFRYVQVSGLPGKAALSALEGEVWNSLPGEATFRLKTSSELLNRMYDLGIWGQRGNFVSIPTDCPQRDERLGWMGDAGVFWQTGTYNFDIGSFTHKFMQDVVDAQSEGGAFANISPDLMGTTDARPGAPGWGDAGILVPYATWMQYGDRGLLEENWAAMERWMGFIERTNPDYLRRKLLGANFGDWLAPDPKTPKDLVGTAYWALLARQMVEMSKGLGRTADAEKYQALYDKIGAAYRTAYVHADGSVEGDTQTSYVVTLYAGLAPRGLEESMTDRLVQNVEAHENHLTTGFLGTPFLLSALDEQGRSDVAYKLLLTESYPSWGYMVQKGATTWWERWNGDTSDPAMNSYNHYSFGSVMAWVYRRVAGIDTDASAAGFHHISIAPQFDAKLSHVEGEYDSVYGTVRTDWTRSAVGGIALSVRVPANATATVRLPVGAAGKVMEDGIEVHPAMAGGVAAMEVGAGSYRFSVR